MVHGLFLEDIRSFSGALIGLHNVLSSLGFYLSEAVGLAMYFDLGPQVNLWCSVRRGQRCHNGFESMA